MIARLPTPLLTFLVAAVTVVAVLLARPERGQATDVAPDEWPPTVDADLVERRQQLDAQHERIAARIVYKERLVTELIEGRATLPGATAEFLRLNQEQPMSLEAVRQQCPGGTDEEKHAYNVIDYVRARRMPADKRAQVLARLCHEFEAHYGHSAIILP